MPEVIGRVIDLAGGRVVTEVYPDPRPPNADRIVALVVAAREFKTVRARSPRSDLLRVAVDKLLAAALEID